MPTTPSIRICLVGTGNIAQAHAEAVQSLPSLEVSAVLDTNRTSAEAFAAKWNVSHVFDELDAAMNSGTFDRAHILIPPDAHASVAKAFLDKGIPVFVEKPLTTSRKECESLMRAAQEQNVPFGVNQNFVYHPAFGKLKSLVDSDTFGPLEEVSCIYNMPLRQLAAKQMGHWMFQKPVNILLEQAVHPLSQVCSIIGDVEASDIHAGKALEIAPGVTFYNQSHLSLMGSHAPAHIHFAVGREFPVWQITAICQDAKIVADILTNRCIVTKRSRWLEFAEHLMTGISQIGQIGFQSLRNAGQYILSTAGLFERSDSFYQSMRSSIEAFHTALNTNVTPPLDGVFGAKLVELCEEFAERAYKANTQPNVPTSDESTTPDYDILVMGGTGFIGRYVVSDLLEAGFKVGVMARNLANLPPVFHDPRVTLIRGDATSADDLSKAILNKIRVVNLAHGGGGDTWEQIQASMVGSAEKVARECLKKSVTKLIHVGSIAGLYLGDPDDVITGQTPPDPQAEERALYARGKAEVDRLLQELHHKDNLPLCILRPGVVVGDGTSPFHSGVGFFNNDQHCMGWNRGQNPIPFVLVSDVASAITKAVLSDTVIGKSYNVVGDIRLTAKEYILALARITKRPLKYHAQYVEKLQMVELSKWLVKRIAGKNVAVPSYRDLKSRGLIATFDTSDIKADLNWQPVTSRDDFLRLAVDHA